MSTLLFGEILNQERANFCIRRSMYKTKFGHRSSGSKSYPASKTAGQTQFDFHFSSGVRKEFLFKKRYSGLQCR
ncbi:MAG: hypothetical protein ACFN3I_07185 [Arachnia propionica]